MARQARKFSALGYLHVIIRGIGKQLLFEEPADYLFFLSILKHFSNETNVTVCAYCLMENHVHLLLYDKERQIPLLMKKLGVKYSAYYNKKYERTGHLFQDRYKSEPVEDCAYLARVFRYILKNPEKAGICNASEYRWNSYLLYDNNSSFVDTSSIVPLIGNKKDYETFLKEPDENEYLEDRSAPHDDQWAISIIHALLNGKSGTVLQSYDRVSRDKAIRSLKTAGLTVRQLERLTGINRGIIQRA